MIPILRIFKRSGVPLCRRRYTVDSIIKQAQKIPSSTLHEAAGKIGALPSIIKPINPLVGVCGFAYPVQTVPGNNLWLHRAIYEAKPGEVLVVSTGGFVEAGYWGEVMTTAAMARGLVGIVIDGGVRDSKRMIELGFPVFSAGLCIRGTTKDKDTKGSLGQSIIIGDVTINRGDVVVGDADGVVVIPRDMVQDVIKKGIQRENSETEIIGKLKKGETTTLDVFKLR